MIYANINANPVSVSPLPDSWENISGLPFLPPDELAALGWLPVLPDETPPPEGHQHSHSTYAIEGQMVREVKHFTPIVPSPSWEAFRSALLLSPEWERIRNAAPGAALQLFSLLWRFNESSDIPALVAATWMQLVSAASVTPEEIAVFRQAAIDNHMPDAIVQLLGGPGNN